MIPENLVGAVLAFFSSFTLRPKMVVTQITRGFQKQDEQCQLPMHKQKHHRGADNAQHRYQKLAGGDARELSTASRSVTRWDATVPLPRVSYSDMETLRQALQHTRLIPKIIFLEMVVNWRVCHTPNTRDASRISSVSTRMAVI